MKSCLSTRSGREEAGAIAQRALELRNERGKWGGMAVLLTGWGALETYESALRAVGARTYALLQEGFYQRPEVVDLLIALEAIRDPMDDLSAGGVPPRSVLSVSGTRLCSSSPSRAKPPWWEWMRNAQGKGAGGTWSDGISLLTSLGELRDGYRRPSCWSSCSKIRVPGPSGP